jgi:uncharacterized FlaG/YvyC family protein
MNHHPDEMTSKKTKEMRGKKKKKKKKKKKRGSLQRETKKMGKSRNQFNRRLRFRLEENRAADYGCK